MKFFAIFVVFAIFACSQVMAGDYSEGLPLSVYATIKAPVAFIVNCILDAIVKHPQIGKVLYYIVEAAEAICKKFSSY